MAAVSLSVDAAVYIMHRSQARRCLCIGSLLDVRARGYTHGSTALLRAPSDLTEPPVQRIGRLYPGSPDQMQASEVQKPFLAVIVIALHDLRGTSTREGSTARSYHLATGFFCAAASGIANRASSTN